MKPLAKVVYKKLSDRPSPHLARVSTHCDTRSSLGWTISYIYYVVLDKTVRIFAYSSTREQSKAENRERDWGQSVFSLASHALRVCEARAVRA